MKPPPLVYRRPGSLDEALDLLREHGDEAKPLAGGQSLVPLLNLRMARPAVLVDLNRLDGLDAIGEANGSIRAGALVRQAAFEASPLVRLRLPLVSECLPFVGHFVTRNRGTVGGSIAHADASAELPLALVALGGSVVAASGQGLRTIPTDEFFVTHFTTALQPDELLVETVWPAAPPACGFAFEELAQRAGDYALSMAACVLEIEDGRVERARVAVASVTDRPTVLAEASALLRGRAVDAEGAREAGSAAAAAVEPAGSLHASGEYLRHITAVLVERAVLRAWASGREAG